MCDKMISNSHVVFLTVVSVLITFYWDSLYFYYLYFINRLSLTVKKNLVVRVLKQPVAHTGLTPNG